jgi:hypothetical protein
MTPRRAIVVGALSLAAASCGTGSPGFPATSTPAVSSLPTVTANVEVPGTIVLVPDPPPDGATVCDRFATIETTGTVNMIGLTEISGVAASRSRPGVLWAHNDSGGAAAVTAIGADGTDLGTWTLDGVSALDWEDIALGPGPDPALDYLYIGDIGDNLAFRPDVMVYRVPEPTEEGDGVITDVTRLRLVYPEPGVDAEALAVDPVTGDLLVVSKGGADTDAVVYRAPAGRFGADPVLLLKPIADLDLGAQVTAADVTADGTVVALRGYREVWMWTRQDADLAAAFSAGPCMAPSPDEVQGEALSFQGNGRAYYTVSEGAGPAVHRIGP